MIRCRAAELMDDPRLDAEVHAHALRSLNRINQLLCVNRRMYSAVRRLGAPHPASVLDLGTGGGGFLHHIVRQRGRTEAGLLIGLDLSTFALGQAREGSDGAIRVLAADAHRIPLADNSVDVVACSLFLHHFAETEVVEILREAARIARRGIVVSDLSRSRLAFVLTWITTRLVSRSVVFRVDGPRSVRNAFRPGELSELARRAGLVNARVRRRFPFGMMLAWRKPEAADGSA